MPTINTHTRETLPNPWAAPDLKGARLLAWARDDARPGAGVALVLDARGVYTDDGSSGYVIMRRGGAGEGVSPIWYSQTTEAISSAIDAAREFAQALRDELRAPVLLSL